MHLLPVHGHTLRPTGPGHSLPGPPPEAGQRRASGREASFQSTPWASDGAQGCGSSAHLSVAIFLQAGFTGTSPLYGRTTGSAGLRRTHGAGLPPRAPPSSACEGPGGVLGTDYGAVIIRVAAQSRCTRNLCPFSRHKSHRDLGSWPGPRASSSCPPLTLRDALVGAALTPHTCFMPPKSLSPACERPSHSLGHSKTHLRSPLLSAAVLERSSSCPWAGQGPRTAAPSLKRELAFPLPPSLPSSPSPSPQPSTRGPNCASTGTGQLTATVSERRLPRDGAGHAPGPVLGGQGR